MLWLLFSLSPLAVGFEGDYVWEERFNASLINVQTGKASAQYDLGEMYFLGRGTVTDHAKALDWFLLAAEQGHEKAAYKAGYLLLHGEGLVPAPRQALNWLQKSALAGYAPAQYELGKLFHSGAVGKRDDALALKWLGKAKAVNYVPAEVVFAQIVSRLVASRTDPSSLSLAALDKKRIQPTVQSTVRDSSKMDPSKAASPDPKRIILRHQWSSSEGPSSFLPSTLTNCREHLAGIECVSASLGRTFTNTRAAITEINPDGQFRLSYANVRAVSLPAGTEGDDLTVQTGGKRTERVLDCALVDGKEIHCAHGAQTQYRFFGRE